MTDRMEKEVDARFLSQILLMLDVIGTLPDEASVFAFLCEGIRDFPGVSAVLRCNGHSGSINHNVHTIPLLSSEFSYGELQITIEDAAAFFPYVVYLKNLCFMVSTIVAARDSRRQDEIREQQRLHSVVQNMPVMLDALDESGNIIVWNREAEMATGYSSEEMVGNPKAWELLYPDKVYRESMFEEWKRRGDHRGWQWNIRAKDGSERLVEWSNISSAYPIPGWTSWGIGIDVTERRRAEERLLLAADVFSCASEGILITDPEGAIVDVNDAFTEITGFPREEAVGRNPRMLQSGRQGPGFYELMWKSLIEEGQWKGEIWNKRKDGKLYAALMTISAVQDHGRVRNYVALQSDITERKEHERQLEHMAHYDPITELPNRALLSDRLEQAMMQAQRRGLSLAVAYLDLDGFKEINDVHGHHVGDQFLMHVASRMKQALREGDTIARIGGDEFVLVLIDLDTPTAGNPILDRVLESAAYPVDIADLTIQVSASIGVAFYPQYEKVDADQLLRQADQAMYQAKISGKNRWHTFDADQDRSIRGRHESLLDISRALKEREFVLYYQPKVNMRSGKIIGAEALIRWQHPERGLLAPFHFLPLVEEHPLSVEIGEWVIDTALRQLESWRETGLDLPVSVNLGARQLQQTDFVSRLLELLAAHPKVSPENLELEVLETSALKDLEHASQVIRQCRKQGIRFALDDFGTGYSSLTYFRHLPIDDLKIDQSFIRNMLDTPDDLIILDGVLAMAEAFGRQVIAEGVETPDHGLLLLQLGCELAQGYGIARPMPASEMPGWAKTWQPDSIWQNQPRVSSFGLPPIYAEVEHRAWIRDIEKLLKGERTAVPELDHRQCRFGRWLEREGQIHFSKEPILDEVTSLHHQVHARASELLGLKHEGRPQEALERLGELQALRDALIRKLRVLSSIE